MGLLTARNVVRTGVVPPTTARSSSAASNGQMRALWGTEMAMVFQDPMTSLNPVMKIGRQITECLRYHLDIPKDEANEQAARSCSTRSASPTPKRRLDQYPHELSGGMRQRVTIAIALACGPKLLFADEPTTALDVTVQAQILNLLNQQQRERHMAMILVTHDLGVVAGRTDEIAVMYAGQIVEKAPTRTLFANVRMPYTEALLKSIPKLEDPSHTRLQIIGGRPPDLDQPARRAAASRPAARTPSRSATPRSRRCVEAETPGHVYRCWFPVGTDAGREALERNLAHHVPAAEAAVTGDSAAAAHVEDEPALVDSEAGGQA